MAFGRKKRRQAAEEEPEEEVVEEEPVEDEGPASGAEFVPEAALKPRSDVFTLVLILTFVAFLAGCIVAGREAWEHYDVQFFVFTKDAKPLEDDSASDQYEEVEGEAVPAPDDAAPSAPDDPAPDDPAPPE